MPSRTPTPAIATAARAIIRDLRVMEDLERAKGVQQYFKHEIVALGIDTPTLRGYCREQVKRLRAEPISQVRSRRRESAQTEKNGADSRPRLQTPERTSPIWTLKDAIALCDQLLQEEEMELRGAGLLILGDFKKAFTPDLIPWAKRWLDTRLDNWALVDGFCGTILSPLLENHLGVEATLRIWSGDPLLWVRRAALVTLVPFARRGQHLELAYAFAREHFSDPEDLMHKATGWLLREAGKTDMPRLRAFLLNHGPAIPRTALRYAIERFPAPERDRLLKLTRPDQP